MLGKLLIETLQRLSWLVLQPSAWQGDLSKYNLSPHFCLAELKRCPSPRHQPYQEHHKSHKTQLKIRRLMALEYGVLPLFIGICVAIGLGLLGCDRTNIVFGTCVGISACLGTAIAGSWTISVAASWIASTIGGLLSGLIFGLMGADSLITFRAGLGFETPDLQLMIQTALPPILLASFPNAVAASVVLNLSTVAPQSTTAHHLSTHRGQQLSGIFLGIVGSGLALAIGGAASSLLGNGLLNNPRLVRQLIAGLLFGGLFGLLLARHTQRWRREVLTMMALGLLLAYITGWAMSSHHSVIRGLAIGSGNALLLSTLFALAYNLAEAIADIPSGAIAGVLGSSSLYTLFVSLTTHYALLPTLLLSLFFTSLGFTITQWLPILLYPFELIWQGLLYRLEYRQKSNADTKTKQFKHSPSLRWHAAYWDHQQRLPYWGLDDYLVHLMNRNPQQGKAAMTYLTTGHQRWAVRNAQIELTAQQLASCRNVDAIATLHTHLLPTLLKSPITPLLTTFQQLSTDTQAALNQSNLYSQRLMLSTLTRQLSSHQQALIRSHLTQAPRFLPILQSWQQTLEQHQQQLTEAAENSQLIESPYIVGIPLTQQQEIFVGRQDISAKIEQLLKERRYTSLLLYGQRRMGKTSLLNNLGKLLPTHIIPLFIDLQGPTTQSPDHIGLLYNLARGMIKSAQQYRNLTLESLSREALAVDPFTVFDEWLDRIEITFGNRTALLALDEFEALEQALSQGRFDQSAVLGMLRHLIQHRAKFKILLSGSHTLDALHHWASYLINLQIIHISYLQPAEARRLIEQPVDNFPLIYEPDATARLITLTRGHPFLVQLLCAEIIALKNEQIQSGKRTNRRQVNYEDVEAAIAPALTSGSFFFADIEQQQAKSIDLLRRLASEGKESAIAPTDILQLNHLTKQGLLEKQNEQHQFQVELIRCWFSQIPMHS